MGLVMFEEAGDRAQLTKPGVLSSTALTGCDGAHPSLKHVGGSAKRVKSRLSLPHREFGARLG